MKELDFSDKIRAEFPQLLDSEAELTKEQKTLPPKLQEMILKKKKESKGDDKTRQEKMDKEEDKQDKKELKEDDKKQQKQHYKDAIKQDKKEIKDLKKDEKFDKKKA